MSCQRGILILMRHGATSGGTGKAIGRTPLPLSREGWRQAHDLAHCLLDTRAENLTEKLPTNPETVLSACRMPRPPRFSSAPASGTTQAASPGRRFPLRAIYSSPAQRCQDTLAPLTAQLAHDKTLVPRIVPGLDEIDLGIWENCRFTDILARFPQAYAARGNDMAHVAPEGGETFSQVAERVWTAVSRIAAGPLPALAVTHAGCLRTVLCRLTDTPLAEVMRFSPPPAHAVALLVHHGAISLLDANIPAWELGPRLYAGEYS